MSLSPRDMIRIIGDSQVHALRRGVREDPFKGRFAIDFLAPGRMIRAFDDDARDEASTSLRSEFYRKIHGWKGSLAFSFGGGEHARTWFYNAATRWHIGEADDVDGSLALTPGLLEAYFYRIFCAFIAFIGKHSASAGVPGALLSAPPIIGDTGLLLRLREEMAIKAGSTASFSSAHTTGPEQRRRIWTASEDVKRALCSEHGIAYIPPPPASFDGCGFIRPELAGDAFHGNAEYGRLVLAMLADRPWEVS